MSVARCPICRSPLMDDVAHQPRPFCSRRCKLADLGNWLEGRYVVADESSQEALNEADLGDLDPAEFARLLAADTEDG